MSQNNARKTKEDDKAFDAHVDCVLSLYKAPGSDPSSISIPKPSLEQVACPSIFLSGELDTQIPSEANSKAIHEALKKSGNNDYTLKIIANANRGF